MKYMGSKRPMLKNGLGELLRQQVPNAGRFVDLFTGSGFVAWYVAENIDKPVLAVDLQKYATVLAKAIIGRAEKLDPSVLIDEWIIKAIEARDKSLYWNEACRLKQKNLDITEWVSKSRKLCEKPSEIGPCWNAYGGHYFSPEQALTIDYLLANLPDRDPKRTVCLAAIISAATKCVAAPGHTAQPFQPTTTAAPFILEAWNFNPIDYCQKALDFICPRHARITGEVSTTDALLVAKTLNKNDLVFIDPPYSDVQYSRFYHVLEIIARGNKYIDVSGIGRYPSINERPQSKFSKIGQAKEALQDLLEILADRNCKIIFTFPSGEASNGLSGAYIKIIANKWFHVEDHSTIEGQFSTMGGNNTKRDARTKSSELILLMEPK
jgi:adenine-specific DNA-methyltransferase